MMDPSRFGQPPPDAIADDEAFSQAMQSFNADPMADPMADPANPNFQPPMEFLEDANDIPRVEDANPFKMPSGEQKLTPRDMPMGGDMGGMMGGDMGAMHSNMMDDGALEMALMETAQQENDNSGAYQEQQMLANEEEEKERGF